MERNEPTPIGARMREVSRRAPDETPDDRMVRLATKAVLSGVRILGEHGTNQLYATSSSNAGRIYRIDMQERTCTCEGFGRTGLCKHIALAAIGFDFAVGTESAPAAVTPVQTITCPQCDGRKGFKRQCGGGLSDWVWAECHDCNGTGTVEVAPSAMIPNDTVQLTYAQAWALMTAGQAYAATKRREMRQNGVQSWAVARDVDRIAEVADDVRTLLKAVEANR